MEHPHEGNDHTVLVRESDWQLGEYDNAGMTGFHGCGYYVNAVSNGWHYLVAVGVGVVTNFYIDGSYVSILAPRENAQNGTDPR